MDKTKLRVYADIPGHQTSAGGTIPPALLITAEKPDIVIIDERKKVVNIFELTVPYEHNIELRNASRN